MARPSSLVLRLVQIPLWPATRTVVRRTRFVVSQNLPPQGHPSLRIHLGSPRMTRVAVVDIGTNSTRLLIADVDPSTAPSPTLVRRSQVTRLGAGRRCQRRRSPPRRSTRVFAALDGYREEIDEHDCEANLAVLTSAVRDAANGAEFAERVRHDFGARRARSARRGRGAAHVPRRDVRAGPPRRADRRDRHRRRLHRVRRRPRTHAPASTSRCLPASCA